MKVRIRRPAILFALLSSFYWFLVSDLVGVVVPVGSFNKQPYWKILATSVLPAAVYAIAALYFCHWLARRVLRQIARKEGD